MQTSLAEFSRRQEAAQQPFPHLLVLLVLLPPVLMCQLQRPVLLARRYRLYQLQPQ